MKKSKKTLKKKLKKWDVVALPVCDIMESETKHAAPYKTVPVKLTLVSQTDEDEEEEDSFFLACDITTERYISIAQQLADAAQYCIVTCASSTKKKADRQRQSHNNKHKLKKKRIPSC